MQFQVNPRCSRLLWKTGAISVASATFLTAVCSATAALQSGIYQTGPGATLLETGDNVPSGSRTVPLTATLTFDLNQLSLTAVIHDAVIEGGSPYADVWLGGRQQPFELTVHSSSGTQLSDGSYRFTGDYLLDIYPSGTQYLFDWQFSSPAAGDPVWNGQTYWAGGHIWVQTISGVTLVPEPGALAFMGTAAAIVFALRRLSAPR